MALAFVEDLQQTLESIDGIIQDSFKRMVQDKELRRQPQGRVSFLATPKATDCCDDVCDDMRNHRRRLR